MTETNVFTHMTDAQGRLVPIERVSDYEKARDGLVRDYVERAKILSESLQSFKQEALGDIAALIDLSSERYGVKGVGGRKGNVTLLSYDGRYKLTRDYSEAFMFDERVAAAKVLIDQCIDEWSEGANGNLRALVDRAFRPNRKGELSVQRITDLRNAPIEGSEMWERAMKALSDCMQLTGRAVYVRVYERVGETDQYRPISLSISNL